MSVIKPYTFSAGGTIIASEHNANYDALYNAVNGNLDYSNLKVAANIMDTQLLQIATAGKVAGTALTSLPSIPSGAGVIPAANLQTICGLTAGTSANNIVQLTAAAKLPAVDGSLLTGVTNASLGTSSGSAPLYAARAWVNFNGTGSNGTNMNLRGNGNVSTVYKNSTGDYTITFTTAMADANYALIGITSESGYGDSDVQIIAAGMLAGSCRINTGRYNTLFDPAVVTIVVFR